MNRVLGSISFISYGQLLSKDMGCPEQCYLIIVVIIVIIHEDRIKDKF